MILQQSDASYYIDASRCLLQTHYNVWPAYSFLTFLDFTIDFISFTRQTSCMYVPNNRPFGWCLKMACREFKGLKAHTHMALPNNKVFPINWVKVSRLQPRHLVDPMYLKELVSEIFKQVLAKQLSHMFIVLSTKQ